MSIEIGVYISNTNSQVAIVTKVTHATVYAITFEGDIQKRIGDWPKEFVPATNSDGSPYPLARAAHRMLYNKYQAPSVGATKSLKEIIMSNSSIITVSPLLQFVGRFPDAATAADCSPKDAIIITSAEDFEAKQFTKVMLMAALNMEKDMPQHKVDAIKKADLAKQLFENYQAAAIVVAEPEKRVRKTDPNKPHKEVVKVNGHREGSKKSVAKGLFNEQFGIKTRQEVILAITETGVTSSTASGWYQRWSKEAKATEAPAA